ncbi:hypothetical protein L4A40_27135 [Bacillus cereus]|uniref:hypothetical protein n=1 Tax=Bacillus cereus TaxID=1396 RepID=UPI001F0E111F|nr:hypothetical protein [Bacillus cereus]MCH5476763.1 hypothetical protein [Bacillus cereus]
MMSEDKITLILMSVITVSLVFLGISYKINNLVVDIVAVLFLLISTAVGAAYLTEQKMRKKNAR